MSNLFVAAAKGEIASDWIEAIGPVISKMLEIQTELIERVEKLEAAMKDK